MTCQMYCIAVQISVLSLYSCSSCVNVNADYAYAVVERGHSKFGIMEMNEVLYDNTTKMVRAMGE